MDEKMKQPKGACVHWISVLVLFLLIMFFKVENIVNIPNLYFSTIRRVAVMQLNEGEAIALLDSGDIVVREEAAEFLITHFLAKQDEIPEKVDLLMVLGSSDMKVAYKAAEIYNQGYAERVLISGGGMIDGKTEAEVFKGILLENGVSEDKILIEKESKNTGENMKNSKALLELNGLEPKSVLLLQTPLFQRRSEATFSNSFSNDVKCFSYAPYIFDISDKKSIVLSLGEIYRLLTWGSSGKGWIADVEMPAEIYKSSRILLNKLQHMSSDIFEEEPWLKELEGFFSQ